MDSVNIGVIAEVLSATSPWGILAVLFIGYTKLQERKDKQIKELSNRLIELSERHVSALAKVESALVSLKEAIDRIR